MSISMICGLHAVRAAMDTEPEAVTQLFVDRKRRDRRMQSLVDQAKRLHLRMEFVEREVLDQHAGGQVHQGVVLLTSGGRAYAENDIDELLEQAGASPLVLVLDGVTDPHNLGACLRTADAAGVDFVVVPKDRAAGLNATARKSASGAAERVPFLQVTNLARTLKHLQDAGLWITGTAMEGTGLYEADLSGPRVIVLGSEGKGMRRLTQEHCDQVVQIPMLGGVESLNVSVATGVVLYEVVRQRTQTAT